MRRVILVTGPPCAGKTTYVRTHAQPGDLILDQDAIGRQAMRNQLAQLPHHQGTAWVIRCAPGPRARHTLALQLGAELVHLVEPEHVIVQRAAHRPNPRRHIAAVAQWFKAERDNRVPVRANRTKGSTEQRGYGWGHQQARARALAGMQDGTPCTRCGLPMWRADSRLLDLDHTEDRQGYSGLAHRRCNRSAGQAKAARMRGAVAQQQAARRSREW